MPYYPQAATSEAVETTSGPNQVNLRHYWHVVLERRWLVIATFASILALTLVYLFKAPRIYAASARIEISPESSDSLNLRPTAVAMPLDQDYLQTQYKNLQSRTLIDTIIKQQKLGEDPRYAKELDITKAVASDITIIPIRLSRLVDVQVEHERPQKASEIANALVDEFVEQNLLRKQKKTLELLFFLRSQATALELDVGKAEEAVQKYRKETGIVSLDSSYNLVAEALTQAQAQYAQEKSRAQTSLTVIDELDKHVAAGKPLETFPAIAAESRVSSLQLQLVNYENELAALVKRYKDKHPTIIQARSRIEETRRGLQRSAQQIAETLRADASLAKAKAENLKYIVGGWETNQIKWNEAKMAYDVFVRKAETSKALYNAVLSKMKEIELVQKDKANNIRVVDRAYVPPTPVKPRIILTLLGGAVGGLGLAIGLALFVNFLDDSIKSQDDVENYLRLPFLGYIPNIKTNSVVERDLQAHLHPQSNVAESFRTVRAAIALGAKAEKLRVFTVTSTIPSEGKSLVASNYAVVLAQTGLRTLLIDADMRRPSLHKAFQLQSPVGLAAYLTEKVDSMETLIHTTEIPNLDVVCCGNTPSQPSELLGSRRMLQFMQEASKRYDRVVIDCPPVSAVSDPLIISAAADALIFVTKFNKIRREHARRTIQRIMDAGIHICGVILNDIDFEGRDSYYYSYYYYQNRYYSSYYRSRSDGGGGGGEFESPRVPTTSSRS